MLDEIKEVNPNIRLVLMEPFILPVAECKENWELWSGVIGPLQEKVKILAEKNNAVFVPLQAKFNKLCEVREPEYWIWDGVHPTVAGHQIIADQWLAYTNELLG